MAAWRGRMSSMRRAATVAVASSRAEPTAADWSWLGPRADGGGWLAPIPEVDLPETLREGPSTVCSLSRPERAVLACLRWWLAGAPADVLARDAALSCAETERVLQALAEAGYVRSWHETLYWGHGHERLLYWGGDVRSSRWLDALPRLPVPIPAAPRHPERVPPEFWKHFWSGTDPAHMRLPNDDDLVAGVLIYDERCMLAKSWALRHLGSDALVRTLELRGLSETAASSIRAELRRRGARGGH